MQPHRSRCHRNRRTGVSFLSQILGNKVIPFKFTQSSKSDLGFDLLSTVNSGCLKLYRQDGSRDYQKLMFELEKAKSIFRPNQTLNFFVDPSDGHDDCLMSLALVIKAAKGYLPRKVVGRT
jgi:hypothetical protein